MSARKIVHFKALLILDPASSRMFFIFVKTCLVSAPTPPGTRALVSLLIPKQPDTYTVPFALIDYELIKELVCHDTLVHTRNIRRTFTQDMYL